MQLYEFTLPVTDNSGRPTKLALAQWEDAALQIAGGYTLMIEQARGAWRDPVGGKVYTDHVRLYRVGCGLPAFRVLLGATFRLFPDQVAIMTAQIGRAEIHSRPAVAA